MSHPWIVLAAAAVLCAAGCFSPTWEARLAVDGGGGRRDGGTCDESCYGKSCGTNGCGHTCGTCPAGTVCTEDGLCIPPQARPDAGIRPDGGGRPDAGARPDGGVRADGGCVPSCAWSECGDDGCGGSCGQCWPGSVCRDGGCLWAECEPPCNEFQWCDTRQGQPVCVELCDPPEGCGPGEVCDVMSGACVPATCEPWTCQAGQGCYDPATLGPGNVCTCLPGHYDGAGQWLEDTCAPMGQACSWDWANPVAAACGAPGEFEACEPALGCRPGLDCVDFGGGTALCLQACARTSDCANPMTNCLPAARSHCWYALCADPEVRPSDRQKYFQPCPSSSASDGICLPYASQDAIGNPIDVGVCVQTGTALSLGACGVEADRTRPDALCPQGQWCAPAAPDPARPGERLGVCRSACNAAPSPVPVARCASSQQTCADLSGANPGTMSQARLGACFPACDPFGAQACPADPLGNPASCLPNFNLDGTAFCYSQAAGAAGKAEPCEWDLATDPRSPCADRLLCVDQGWGGTCAGLCEPTQCPDPFGDCPACEPFSMCYPVGATLGICL